MPHKIPLFSNTRIDQYPQQAGQTKSRNREADSSLVRRGLLLIEAAGNNSPKMAMRKFDSNKDYYEILGVKEGASKGEIDRSYRTLARDQHPDRGGSEEAMKSLNEAREVLTDPDMRHAYDKQRMPERIPTGSSAASFDPNAASKAGTLKINVSEEDAAGLIFAAATCFGIGIPLLILIEMQWVFFLWPLRFLTIGAIGLGVILAHAAMRARLRRAASNSKRRSVRLTAASEVGFWLLVFALGYLLYFFLYSI